MMAMRRRGAWMAVVAAGLAMAPVALATGVWGAETPAAGEARATEPVGMIAEIRNERGAVAVRAAGGMEWRPAAPLQALRPGDAVRAEGGGTAVVVLSGGQGTVKVDAGASPYVVPAPGGGTGTARKALDILRGAVGYLSTGTREPAKAVLSTRGTPPPPAVLSPRNGPVLPGPMAVEWLGSRFARYTVRIAGPSGTVLERIGFAGSRLEYPGDAPALALGTRYTIGITGTSHPAEEAWFEVADGARAQTVRQDLADLDQALGPAAPANTRAALRAGLLASRGFLHDARRDVLEAIARDPDEPTLHQLLGDIYARTGLPREAEAAYDEAQFLLTRGAPAAGAPAR